MSRLYLARNPRVAARSLDGEMMIMSGRDSTLFTLNKTATILWQSADGTTPLDEIVELRICREFEVEPAEALHDAESWHGNWPAMRYCKSRKNRSRLQLPAPENRDERSAAGNVGRL